MTVPTKLELRSSVQKPVNSKNHNISEATEKLGFHCFSHKSVKQSLFNDREVACNCK